MPIRSLLLRLSLSVVLVLNGIASAAAGVRMGEMTDAGAVAKPDHAMVAGMPCHEHRAAMSSHAMEQAVQIDAKTPAGKQPAAPDCCKSGLCQCACAPAYTMTAQMWPSWATSLTHDPIVRRLPLGHTPPALPHLIRPPIG